MAHHNLTGKEGEALAAEYLLGHDYIILHKNWRHARWEIDIIAEKAGVLHFVEVKTRTSTKFGHPEDNVTKKKIQSLMSAGEQFLYKNPGWKRVQYDVLSITLLKDQPAEYFLILDVYVY